MVPMLTVIATTWTRTWCALAAGAALISGRTPERPFTVSMLQLRAD
jgi:hypothetical protein